MKRRSNQANGWVNFPTHDPNWVSSNEGGMSVYLVANDDEGRWPLCSWSYIHINQSEPLAGSYDSGKVSCGHGGSKDYLACLLIGTTGWSGWNEVYGKYWHCNYEDLSEQGKELYKSLQRLYPSHVLSILTFLDT